MKTLNNISILLLSVLSMLAVSCQKDEVENGDIPENSGRFSLQSLGIDDEIQVVGTKAFGMDANTFIVELVGTGEENKDAHLTFESFSKLKEQDYITLPVGKYTVKAYSRAKVDGGVYDDPYFYGENTEVVILEKKITTVPAINCTFQSVAVDINLTQSLLVGFDNYFKFIHASWLSPIIAIALAFGVLAGVLTWVAGPSKGIFAVGKAGYMPPFFQKTNKLGVQKNILFVQGIAVTVLSLLFVVMPSVQSFYQILSQLTVILYLIMYLLMFSGAIALRYKMKKLNRPFRIGKSGNGLMWFVGGLGFCGSLLAFILSFIPPSQISTGSNTVWFSVLIIGAIIVVVAPFIIYASKKPSWVDPNSNFEPFHWEVQAQPATANVSASSVNAPRPANATSAHTGGTTGASTATPGATASNAATSGTASSGSASFGSSSASKASPGTGDKDKDAPKS